MERGGQVSRVIAAIDDTYAAGPVLATGGAVARLFGATLEAVHVRQNGHETVTRLARDAGVSLSTVQGSVVESLIELGTSADVEALVLGTRDEESRTTPLGSTALEVVGAIATPVVLVPPRADALRRIRHVLLPLEGTRPTSLAPVHVLDLARDAAVDVLVLHVLDESSLPLFTDQPQHETETWAREFLTRYCPRGLRSVQLALRVGRPEDAIVDVAEASGADLVALGWNQRLAPDRAAIVRSLLEHGRAPMLLVPTVRAASREPRRAA
jgi:nucleotide-binding universal stress UspA family protein